MKRLLPLIFIAACAAPASAQTVSFLLPVTPCHNDGTLVANMTGLTPPLTVSWTTYGTTHTTIVHTVTGLTDALTAYSGGPVDISVTDGTSTVISSYAGTPPFGYSIATTDAICPSPGTATATAAGGTAPYTYQWYDVVSSTVVGTGGTITQPSGAYGVVITDAAGCTYGSLVNTDMAAIGYESFTATVTATVANCTDGTATVSGVSPAAVLPVNYSWSNGASTQAISGLTTGNYEVTITDATGCKATAAPAGSLYAPMSAYVPQSVSISTGISSTAAACGGATGTASVFASGGTAPYTYLWSNGVTTQSQSGLTTGSYNVTVTDAHGCIAADFGGVGNSSTLSVTTSSSPSLCSSATGNATVHITGGTGTYAIVWNTTPAATGATATFLAPGDYMYTVTDGAGCVQTGSVTVYPVSTISTGITGTNSACSTPSGTLTVMALGGVAPYTYLWSTGATAATITALAAGTYSVTVTDHLGCKAKVSHNVLSNSTMGVGMLTTQASCMYSSDGSINATPYGGTAPYTFSWSNGNITAFTGALASGPYSLNITDAAGCKTTAYSYVGYDAANTSCYAIIQGTIFADTNANCSQEPTEQGIPHIQVYCSGIGYTYTDANGGYSFMVPSGSYTITEHAPAYYPMAACQLNDIAVTATAGTGVISTVNFANNPATVHSLAISTSSYTQAIPGSDYKQQLTIINEGTVTEDAVVASYKADGQVYAPAFTTSGIFSGSANYYSSAPAAITLAPGASTTFYLDYNVPANIPAGTSIKFHDTVANVAPMLNYLADNTPNDNINAYSATVVATKSANFNEVYPKGSGANGYVTYSDSVLQYTVHFENTGSWYTQNVTVIDTLDANLDWTSLHPMYESAPCTVSMMQVGTRKVVKFTFDNINLSPMMFADMRSNGTLTYSIKMLPGLAAGTQFRSKSAIYFDYNAPETTNTTLNTLTDAVVAVNNAAVTTPGTFAIFPNPANNTFSSVISCTAAGTGNMSVTDVSGKTMLSKTMALQNGTQTIVTDISQFATGIYFVTFSHSGKMQTQKLVVIR